MTESSPSSPAPAPFARLGITYRFARTDMHDGSVSTLRDVIDFYNAGGGGQRPRSPLLRKLKLTEREKADLEAFLESLSGTVEKMEMSTAEK